MKEPTALLVMPRQLQPNFRRIVSAGRVQWTYAETCHQARQAFAQNPDFAVVVSEATLPDGSWYCVLDELVRRDSAANLIVVACNGIKDDVVKRYDIFGVLRRPLDESALSLIEAAAHALTGLGQTAP